METVTLRDLIIAAKEGKKFRASTVGYNSWINQDRILNEQWSQDSIVRDWKVSWIKEPLKWEGEVTAGFAMIQQDLPLEFNNKKFKMTLVEVTDGR
jgi:hypothetical protein